MKNIIVAGYPKSGNTWVTRLTAELVGCPVAGFWQRDHFEVAQEGSDRESDFRCFKSHHQLHELNIEGNPDKCYIIYVVRDPRDIIISGSHHFEFKRSRRISCLLERVPRVKWWYHKALYRVICPKTFRVKEMINAILHGSVDVHHWCRVSWKNHLEPYFDRGCLFIKYEDLLAAPENECKRILAYLDLSRQESQIYTAIENQSFEKKKDSFLKGGEKKKAKFLRSGKSRQWDSMLSQKQKNMLTRLLRNELLKFSYTIEDDAP